MSVMKKMKVASSTLPVGIGVGVLAALTAALLGSMLAAYMISHAYISQNSLGYCAMAILTLSSVLGALIAAGRVKRLRLQVCMITGAAYYLLLLAMTALFFGGQYHGMGTAAVMVLLGAGAAALMGMPMKKRRKFKEFKKVYR